MALDWDFPTFSTWLRTTLSSFPRFSKSSSICFSVVKGIKWTVPSDSGCIDVPIHVEAATVSVNFDWKVTWTSYEFLALQIFKDHIFHFSLTRRSHTYIHRYRIDSI